MAVALTPAKLKAARGNFFVFNICSSFSFVLLSGSFVTLFALRLGASNSFVGLLNALAYATFFLMPLGKRLVKRYRIVDVFGWGWLLRYLAMLPLLAAPLLAALGYPGVGFGFIIAGVAFFNVFRGIGLIGNNPVLAFLAEGRDRGSFLVSVQIINSIAGMATSLIAALVLGRAAGMGLYLILMASAIAMGVFSSILLLRTPEPENYRPPASSGLLHTARDALREPAFRIFIEVLIIVSFISGMARSFLPVYAKEAYAQGDDLVMILSLLGSLGSLAMGLLTRLLVDRLGAKPLIIIFTAVSALSLVPAVFSPAFASPAAVVVFLGLFNFLSSFGLSGEENAGQTYYFALVPRERTLDLAVVYFIAYGLGGALGATSGGILLEALRGGGRRSLGLADSYRVFFGMLLAGLVWALFRMTKLVRLGSVSVRESLNVIFSFRDLRAFDLLARLDKSEDQAEEIHLIRELGQSASPRSQSELLGYLASPRFETRLEALLAIENIDALEAPTLSALSAEVERNPYTTAYIAARILGKRGGPEAAPVLRRAALTQDYMLEGSALVALARLGDRESMPTIEAALTLNDNPRVRISAAYALELLGDRDSVPALVSCLRRDDPPAYVSDELVLSIAGILGLLDRFYPMYSVFLEDEKSGLAMLEDAAADLSARAGRAAGRADNAFDGLKFREALEGILADPPRGAPMSRLVLGHGVDPGVEIVLAEAALDQNLGYRGFRFFLAAYALLA